MRVSVGVKVLRSLGLFRPELLLRDFLSFDAVRRHGGTEQERSRHLWAEKVDVDAAALIGTPESAGVRHVPTTQWG